MILGEVYEFGSDDFTNGQDYLKVIFLKDSRTDLLYLELYPKQILGITAVAGYGVLISTREWIYYWNTLDADSFSWKAAATSATQVAAGNSGIIAIADNGTGKLDLLRAFDGEKVASASMKGVSIGKPFVSPDGVWVCGNGSVIKYDFELGLMLELKLPGLSGAGDIYGFDWGLMIVGSNKVFKLGF